MSTVAIVQARMGSSRFPGKMAAPLGNAPLMEWVLRRCVAAQRLDKVVLATSEHARDDVLADIARDLSVALFRGSEADVLGRYSQAAKAHDASTVVRICGDRPLVDPVVVDLSVDVFAKGGTDLTFNHISEGAEHWPRGFGAEVLSADHLHWMANTVDDPYHREHVTSFMWHNRDRFTIAPAPCPLELDPGFQDLRFDVDTPEDLELLRRVLPQPDIAVTAQEVVSRWRDLQTGA